jgi:hypothetical protein
MLKRKFGRRYSGLNWKWMGSKINNNHLLKENILQELYSQIRRENY